MPFVVDASIAGAWLFANEQNEFADNLMLELRHGPALVPSLFWHEARNLFLQAERRGRTASGEAIAMMRDLRRLPLTDTGGGSEGAVLELAAKHALTPYDACYLALALERKLPLATFDYELAAAARKEGVLLLRPLADG